jgi:tetratricopeptide (TPR) repeat protein
MKTPMVALAVLLAASASQAADKPGERPADKMAGMQMSAPMSMGVLMSPMPSVYAGEADKPGAPVFKGLGVHHVAISTKVPETQRFFDQGVNLLFGFNHAEAIRSFREAARLDPDCAMCWWGMSFALGPNINLPMPPDAVAPAWQALQQAQARAAKASPRERAWIAALATRYSKDPGADRHALDEAYAAAMGQLWRETPSDLEAGTFYAEALMDTQPWDYWQADAATPKGHGGQIVSTLETVLRQAPNHPGALHLYIHAVEASTTPERAEGPADRLLVLMPEAGHVVHMPSHIYYRVGRYADAARVNELAAKVDEAYIAACKAQGFYPAGYYGHNIHFLWTSAEMEGRFQVALDASRRLIKAVDANNAALQLAPAEVYTFTPVVTLLRFGKYREVLAEPAPDNRLVLNSTMWLYAQAFAHANLGDLKAAQADRAKLAALQKSDFARYDAFGVPVKQMIPVALESVDGEIARKSGDLAGAAAHFRKAVELQEALPYTEPAYWHRPVAHLLGAALLEAGKPAEAEAVYRQSLKTYRRDGWALVGLARALKAQGKDAEAAKAQAEFAEAWRMADTRLESSRL